MASVELQEKAKEAWREYGKAIIKAFRFPEGSKIDATGLPELLSTSTDEELQRFISHVHELTRDVVRARSE